jgi:predicted DCC family thiol-disulfide oxidoreductase YuxK
VYVDRPIVLFDGVCKFCDASVNFLIDHDRAGRLRFAALQSQAGQDLLRRFGLRQYDFDTAVLVEGERFSTRSTAVLRIASYLPPPFRYFAALLLLPAFLRDPAYNLLIGNRYRWFGRYDACRIPTPELKARFLD